MGRLGVSRAGTDRLVTRTSFAKAYLRPLSPALRPAPAPLFGPSSGPVGGPSGPRRPGPRPLFRFRRSPRFVLGPFGPLLSALGGPFLFFGPRGPRLLSALWPSVGSPSCLWSGGPSGLGLGPRSARVAGGFGPVGAVPPGPLGPWPPAPLSPHSGFGSAGPCHSLQARRAHTLPRTTLRRGGATSVAPHFLPTSVAPVFVGLREVPAADLVRSPRPRLRSRRAAADFGRAVLRGLR